MLRQLLRRVLGTDAAEAAADPRPGPMIDALEGRLLMASHNAPPVVTDFRFLGTSQNTTGFVLTFNTALAPATANDKVAYELARKVTTPASDGFFGVGGTDASSDIKHISLASATYDDATHSVTLIPNAPLEIAKTFRRIRIQGERGHAVRTASGDAIDGNQDGKPGGDVVITFKSYSKRSLSYRDPDGDRVKITLDGPGRLVSFVPKDKATSTPIIFIREADPARTVISGTVKKAKRGDGVAVIPQILGTAQAQVQLKGDPHFHIVSEVA